MRDDAWLDLGPLSELADGEVSLRKARDGKRFACVRRGQALSVLDDRCPHEGYPLSQGQLRDGVLTCAWHNWKFDASDGTCRFGGESVRSHPCRVRDGRVEIDTRLDVDAERARLSASLVEALVDDDVARAVRDGLRLSAIDPGGQWPVVVETAATRAEHGFEHDLASIADLVAWVAEGLVPAGPALSVAATSVGESHRKLPRRAVFDAGSVQLVEPDDPRHVLADLKEERREHAEARVRALVATIGPDRTVAEALAPFVAWHNLDYGHGAIFLTKALELARRYPAVAEEVLASVTVQLGWATRETALPGWRRTARALDAVDELGALGDDALSGRDAYETSVLGGETDAVEATMRALAAGIAPSALLVAVAHAAAIRVARFDRAWEQRPDAPVTILGVSHALTFAEAALVLCRLAEPRVGARVAVQAAAFVGKLARADGPNVAAIEGGDLEAAIGRRDLAAAFGAVRSMDGDMRQTAYRQVAPYAALDAFVRPILVAHAIKMTEACRRLDAEDPNGGAAYIEALCAVVVPRRPERAHRRTAHVAQAFLQDGRPPPGLY